MTLTEENLPDLKNLLNAKVSPGGSKVVTELEIVEKKSIMHYSDRIGRFVKVSTVLPKYIAHLRAHIEKGVGFNGSTFWTITYESNLPHSLRFMIDNEVVGMSWVDILKGTYTIRPRSYKKTTN